VVLVEIGDQGISPVIVGESLEMLNTNADVTTASRVITAVEASLAALSSGDLDELRSQIKEIDAEKLLEGGVARSEFIAWTKDRDNLFKFLAK
jgi:acetylglutamate kinase